MRQYMSIAKAIQLAMQDNPTASQYDIVNIAQDLCLRHYGFSPRKCELQRLVKHYHRTKDKKAEFKAVARMFESEPEPQPQLIVESSRLDNAGVNVGYFGIEESVDKSSLAIKNEATVKRDKETALEEYTEGQKPAEYDYIQRFKLVHKY